MKNKVIVYWATTTILALAIFSGGVAELARQRDTVAGMVHLGYPLYFVTIIGYWKVLGTVALLVPRFPRVKEWAYAGIFFNMTGAAVSHAVCGDAAWHIAVTLGFAALAVISWALRPQSRKLETGK
ncbi:MAG TPA: DoxX family protein [Verrucomicrobiae bacterium]|nr:DoxX family protein [Verrucomicrobiae bacterium]